MPSPVRAGRHTGDCARDAVLARPAPSDGPELFDAAGRRVAVARNLAEQGALFGIELLAPGGPQNDTPAVPGWAVEVLGQETGWRDGGGRRGRQCGFWGLCWVIDSSPHG